jgi:hypothetical protein
VRGQPYGLHLDCNIVRQDNQGGILTMSEIGILRYWAIDVIMHCTDKDLLDFVSKLLIHEVKERQEDDDRI